MNGEIVAETPSALRGAIDDIDEEIGKRRRDIAGLREIRDLLVLELTGAPAVLPKRRYRTDSQLRYCPRCTREINDVE
jgi:hypothetical protein